MIPQFATKEQRLDWLRKQDKSLLYQAKKLVTKQADSVVCVVGGTGYKPDVEVVKELGAPAAMPTGAMQVKAVINTTNILDSHMDVHIPGLWKKSLSEVSPAKPIYHLQEHQMKFEKVISDEVKAFTKRLSWKSLGYDYPGNTEALVFDSTIQQARNPFMFDQYSAGYVKNHSVGMRYVKLLMCVNSEEKYWVEEKDNWDKYYPQIVNQDDADELGMFWAVLEAKIVEGSAVLVGSNPATPTLETTGAGKSTPEEIEPSRDTRPERKGIFAAIGSKL